MQFVLTRSKLTVDATARDLLREECAARKEAVGPQTRRFLVDLTAVDDGERPPFSCAIDDVYSGRSPLVDKTTALLDRVLSDPIEKTRTWRGRRWPASMWWAEPGASRWFPDPALDVR